MKYFLTAYNGFNLDFPLLQLQATAATPTIYALI